MGGLSVWHWLIFLAVALLLFGGSGKISSIMGDVAKGIKSFKKGMAEDEDTAKKDEPAKGPRWSRAPRAKPITARPWRPTSPAGAPRPELPPRTFAGRPAAGPHAGRPPAPRGRLQ